MKTSSGSRSDDLSLHERHRLRGILESGKLWLSDVFSLNDPSELRHGFSIAVDVLRRRAANGSQVAKAFAQQMEAFGEQGGGIGLGNFFIRSFSSTDNDLGQWRAYADNGRGYALGFLAKDLELAFVQRGTDSVGLVAGLRAPRQTRVTVSRGAPLGMTEGGFVQRGGGSVKQSLRMFGC